MIRAPWTLLFAIAVVAAGCGPRPAPEGIRDPGLARADSLVTEAVEEGLIPGAVLLVARHGEILAERAYGFAQVLTLPAEKGGAAEIGSPAAPYERSPVRLDPPRPMTAETTFDLASVTKVMATTMAVMLLVDEGSLEVVSPVARYLPEFRGIHKDSITIRHLLTHSSGLAQWQPLYYAASSPREALRVIEEIPLGWGVGEGRHYSDLGFMLLGLVVERVTGMSLDAFLSRALYGPAGLHHTGFRPRGCDPDCPQPPFAATSHGNPYEYRMVHDTAFGYRYSGDPSSWDGWRRYTLIGEVNDGNAFHAFGGVAGHAGLFATAEELEVLLRLLLDGGEANGHRFFGAGTVREFLASTEFGQALGWQTPAWAPAGSFSHTGFTGTFVMGIPSRGMAVVLLTNRQNLGVGEDTLYPDLGDLQRGVVEAVVGDVG